VFIAFHTQTCCKWWALSYPQAAPLPPSPSLSLPLPPSPSLSLPPSLQASSSKIQGKRSLKVSSTFISTYLGTNSFHNFRSQDSGKLLAAAAVDNLRIPVIDTAHGAVDSAQHAANAACHAATNAGHPPATVREIHDSQNSQNILFLSPPPVLTPVTLSLSLSLARARALSLSRAVVTAVYERTKTQSHSVSRDEAYHTSHISAHDTVRKSLYTKSQSHKGKPKLHKGKPKLHKGC
jgi:hypothetical protein